jgi:hypothetical protein
MFRQEYADALEDAKETIKLYWDKKSIADINRAVKVELNSKGITPTDSQLINFVVFELMRLYNENNPEVANLIDLDDIESEEDYDVDLEEIEIEMPEWYGDDVEDDDYDGSEVVDLEDDYDQEMADLAQANQWADREAEKFLAEYPPGAEVRTCWKCGRVMKYKSLAYDEGFHFDSCI